jgi:phage terminase small subunit
MSPANVAKEASRLLANPHIAPLVAAARQALAEKHGITAEWILGELKKIAGADVRKVVTWSGAEVVEEGKAGKPGKIRAANDVLLVSSDQIDDATAAAIAEISQGQFGVRIKFHDKLAALDKLGRHAGVFEEPPERETTIIIRDLRGERTESKKGGSG